MSEKYPGRSTATPSPEPHCGLFDDPQRASRGRGPDQSYHILAADGDPVMRQFYEAAVPALGHRVSVAGTGRRLVDLYRAGPPDLIITALDLPELDALDDAGLCRDQHIPFIVVSGTDGPGATGRWADLPVFAYLVKPVHRNCLGPAIAVAMRCVRQTRALTEEVAQLRQALEDRKLIERAKGMVCRYAGMGEEDAYRSMRRVASDGNRKLVEVAHDILRAGAIFHVVERAGDGGPPDDSHARPPRTGAAPG